MADEETYDERVARLGGFPAPLKLDADAPKPNYAQHLEAYEAGDAGGTAGTPPESDDVPPVTAPDPSLAPVTAPEES